MEATDSLIACLVALSAGLGTWGIGAMLSSFFIQWQKRLSTEAEFELQNMFLQLPARSIFIYSLSIAGFLGIFLFCIAIFLFSWSVISALIISTIVFLLCLFLPRLIIRMMKRRRHDRFNEQLEDALMSMSNALKAGFSIIQAIEVIIKQNRQPISIEFKLMLQHTQLGMSFGDALNTMAKRVDSEDFNLVSIAILTARQMGGNLTDVFERLAAVIRKRMQIQRRIKSLTAQGRLQSNILSGLPLLFLLALYLINPLMVQNFFAQPLGIFLFILVLILIICAFLMIKKIIAIDI